MKRLIILGCLFVTPLISNEVFAYGASGHHAVCEIAYAELTDTARAKVDEILQADPDTRFHNFGRACGWPDLFNEFGSILSKYGSDHYINVPRGTVTVAECFDPAGNPINRCLLGAIERMGLVLSDNVGSDLGDRDNGFAATKTEAIRFLGHWMGDIHQPLHVSYADDKGGNDVLVEGVSGCARNGVTKLHTVWDTCTVHDSMQERGFTIAAASRQAYAEQLQNEITATQRAIWGAISSPLSWANESYALAQGGLVKYCINVGGECHYSETSETFDGTFRVIDTSEEYEDVHREIIEMRIKQAGVRLGALLNSLFGV